MHPRVILVPLFIVAAGVATFFLVPLPPAVRIPVLVSDLLGAGVVGFLLWRRAR